MRLLILAAALTLAGCQTMQQQQRPTAANDPSQHCYSVMLAENPDLEILVPKIGSLAGITGIPIEVYASTAKPTDQEKAALAKWDRLRDACYDRGRSFRAQYAPPGFVVQLEAGQVQVKQQIVQLYSGNITYGQFATARQQIAVTNNGQLNAIDRQNAEAMQRDDAQRRALAAQFLLQQQQIQNQNRPITTTCDRFGSTTNCTTR